jgi:hypothetical protein
METVKKMSWTMYLVVLICFLMPFMKISCGGQSVATVSGVQLATGFEMSTGYDKQKVPADPKIIAVLALAGLGLISLIVFKKTKAAFVTAGGASVLAAALLVIFKITTDNDVLKQGEGLVQVSYGAGYWGALLINTALVILMFYLGNNTRKK